MKKLLAAALLAAFAVTAVAGDAEAQRRGGGRTRVIQTSPSVDLSTLLLLGAMGGGNAFAGGGGSLLLPFLLAPQTTVIEERGRRGGRRLAR
jgi:hypothetical protein